MTSGYLWLQCIVHIYSIRLSSPGGGCSDGDAGPVVVEDLHATGGCGPVAVENADITTPSNCDRTYTLGAGFTPFFDRYGTGMTLIQDAHDPNDQ